METVKSFGSLDIESFGVSMMLRSQCFMSFIMKEKNCLITDTGYVSDRMKGTISNADAYVFESNHDVNAANGTISMEYKTKNIK